MTATKTRTRTKAKIEAIEETISAKLAEEYLRTDGRNRHFSKTRVGIYAKAMEDGDWEYNAEPIRFDDKGELIDGQHRLAAVVKTELPHRFLVVRGLPTEAIYVTDRGKQKSLADFFAIRGELNYTQLAATVRQYGVYKLRGDFRGTWNEVRSVQNHIRLLEQTAGLRDSTVAGRSLQNAFPVAGAGLWGAVYHILAEIDNDDTEAFFGSLVSGTELPLGSPILNLRDRLAGARAVGYTMGHKRLPLNDVAALTFKSWNYWRRGDQTLHLQWRPGGNQPEPFPVPE